MLDTPHKRLKHLLIEEGIKQKNFAKMLGVTNPFISALVNGKKPLTKKMAMSIQHATGYSADWLLAGEGEPKIKQKTDFVTREEFERALKNLDPSSSIKADGTANIIGLLTTKEFFQIFAETASRNNLSLKQMIDRFEKIFDQVRAEHPGKTMYEALTGEPIVEADTHK